MNWLRRLLCLGFGVVFVYAGVLKLWNPIVFLDDVRSFHILPDPYAAWLALGLPWLEILCGLAVVTGVLRRGGLLLLNLSLVVFLIAIASAQARGIDIRCGCFGASSGESEFLTLYVRDVVLLAAGLALFWLERGRRQNRDPRRLRDMP